MGGGGRQTFMLQVHRRTICKGKNEFQFIFYILKILDYVLPLSRSLKDIII